MNICHFVYDVNAILMRFTKQKLGSFVDGGQMQQFLHRTQSSMLFRCTGTVVVKRVQEHRNKIHAHRPFIEMYENEKRKHQIGICSLSVCFNEKLHMRKCTNE